MTKINCDYNYCKNNIKGICNQEEISIITLSHNNSYVLTCTNIKTDSEEAPIK